MNKFSIRQFVAPWIGAGIGALAAHGMKLSAADSAELAGGVAAFVASAVHWLEARFSPKPLPPPTFPKAGT